MAERVAQRKPSITKKMRAEVVARGKEIVLEEFSKGMSIGHACLCAGVTRQTYYNWKEADKQFAQAAEDAIEAGTDLLEDEATRRANKGVQKPVFFQDKIIGQVTEYSDKMMDLILKGRRPAKFNTPSRIIEKVGPGGGSQEGTVHDVSPEALAKLTVEQLAELHRETIKPGSRIKTVSSGDTD